LVQASRRHGLLRTAHPGNVCSLVAEVFQVRFGGTPEPALGTSALPGTRRGASSLNCEVSGLNEG
ncbi:MAG: hypothetical protein M3463_23585, partial [Verrucomicrobiota bacterium]|nr:hypothetical protein [Verrucomicrobiota bacterium]